MPMVRSKSSSVVSSSGANWATPALTKSTSTRPYLSPTASNSPSMSARLAASERSARASPPIWRAASASVRASRPVMTTRAPSRANSLAVARPIPEFPPVTTATLPSSLPAISPQPFWFLERSFQKPAKNLVQHRERHAHHVFERLAVARRLRHELQPLQTAVEEPRHGAQVAPPADLALPPAAQQRAVERLLRRGQTAAGLLGRRAAAPGQLRRGVPDETPAPLALAERALDDALEHLPQRALDRAGPLQQL